MQIGKGRPLACFCWLLAIVAAFYAWGTPSMGCLLTIASVLLAIIVALLIFGYGIRRARYSLFYAMFLVLALLIGICSALLHEYCRIQPAKNYAAQAEGQTVEITGVVISEEYYSNYLSCVGARIDLPDAHGMQAKTAKAYLNLSGENDLRVGDRFRMSVTVFTTEDAPEDEAQLHRLRAEGYTLVAYLDDPVDSETLERGGFVLTQWLSRLQYRMSDRLSDAVGDEEGRLVAALLLGTKQELSETTTLDFRRAGASHLLALSGLHLSLIMVALSALLSTVRCPFYLRTLILSLTAVLFLALTGFCVSMLRATVMLLCLYLSRLRGCPHDSLTPLSAFLGVVLTVDPMSVYDAGLWLTVLATFALIAVIPALFRKNGTHEKQTRLPIVLRWLWNRILMPMLSSLVILFFLLLPMALIFGEVSLLSPVSNLLLTPLTAACLTLGLAYFPLSYLGELIPFLSYLSGLLTKILHALSGIMLAITERLSDIRGTVLSLRYDFVDELLLLLVVILLLFLLPRWKRPKRFFVLMSGWIAAFAVCLLVTQAATAGQWQATYVSNKKNELLCFSSNDATVLCDVTDGSYTTYRDFFAEDLPDATTEIEALVLTHYHNRHISTVYKLLGDIRVRSIWLPMTMPDVDQAKAIKDEGNLRAIVALAKQRRVEVHYYLPQEGADILDTLTLERLYFSMLERSSHPTVSMTWTYRDAAGEQGNRMTWLGASAWESELADEILASATSSNALLIAAHGPVIKTQYTLSDWSLMPDLILFANGDTSAALEPTSETAAVLRRAKLILGEDYAKMTLP